MDRPKTQADLVKDKAQLVIQAAEDMKAALAVNDLKRVREMNQKLDNASGFLSSEFVRLAQYDANFR